MKTTKSYLPWFSSSWLKSTTLADCSNVNAFHFVVSTSYLTIVSLFAITSIFMALPSWTCSSKPCIFSNKVLSCVSLVYIVLYFYSLSSCTFDSKLKHLACKVSFYVCISRNFCSTFFKHPITNSISSVCLTNLVVNITSWGTSTFFISSTLKWMCHP